jgi:ABC-2 type transport system ATP-binding protein
MKSRLLPLAGALALVATLIGVAPTLSGAAAGVTVTNGCVDSKPEPGTTDKIKICYTLFRPAGASATHPVPMIMHSHGWGGSRTTDPAAFAKWFEHGYAVISFDQRGFGESGGYAHIMNPHIEGNDVQRLVDLVAKLPWVQLDAKGDPRMGAIGGSYGGGYQFMGAFRNIETRGKPVFDALAPEITWNDLVDSLAPSEVTRGEWALALSAAGTDALEPAVLEAVGYGATTGTWPDGSVPGTTNMDAYLAKNGPKWQVAQGRKLDIPVLFGQGTTDTLFPLQQGLANWRTALTPNARKHSIFVGYNGGHVLPGVFPSTDAATSDPCSKQLAGGSFEDLTIRFFDEQLKHRDTQLHGYGSLHLATAGGSCISVRSVRANTSFAVGSVSTTEAAGAPSSFKVVDGPIRIAGTPYLTGTMTALGLNNRAFYGLAVGTSSLDAKLVQGNVLPVNEPDPVLGEWRHVALPSVAVNVPRGKSLFILASPISDTFVGMGTRTPGAITIDSTVVHLPVVG